MRPTPLQQIASWLNLFHPSCTLIKKAAIDSRLVERDDLFFALPGNRVEGVQFLKEVANKGAAAAVVPATYQGEAWGLPLLRVPNVLEALQEVARKFLESTSMQVAAITGSLGKTTTKEFAKTLLQTQYRVCASPHSYNSQATVPVSILMAEGDEQILLLEMGMSEPGQIARLVSIAPPDVALLTTAALQHVQRFPEGLSAIAREKASIFAHPTTRLGLLLHEMPYAQQCHAVGSCPKQTFSLHCPEADFFLPDLVTRHGLAVHLPLPIYDQNFLAAVALARAFDVSWQNLKEGASSLKLPPMRFERVEKRGIVFINDAYNANPDSMKAALSHLPKPQGGKTIAVLSSMDALGAFTQEGHTAVAEVALQHVDVLLCVGKCEAMREVWQSHHRDVELFEERSALEKRLQQIVKPGDVVLLKGARAFALDHILHIF